MKKLILLFLFGALIGCNKPNKAPELDLDSKLINKLKATPSRVWKDNIGDNAIVKYYCFITNNSEVCIDKYGNIFIDSEIVISVNGQIEELYSKIYREKTIEPKIRNVLKPEVEVR